MKIISAYLWAFKNFESGIKSLKSVRQFYPDADLFINVDYEGDFINYRQRGLELEAHISRNNFQLGYCGNFGNVNVGRDCWDKEATFEWFRGFYEACKKTNSKYIILLEEDDFVLKPLSICEFEFSCAIHPTDPSPTGRYRKNFINEQFYNYSRDFGGTTECPGYASGGGTIINREEFILAWDKCKNYLFEHYDKMVEINKIIGWIDFSLQYVMMLGGYKIIQNPYLCEHWEVPVGWEDFEIITGLKDHNLISI